MRIDWSQTRMQRIGILRSRRRGMEPVNALDKANDMKRRTKRFALRIVNLCRSLPRCQENKVVGNQMLRSGTSVGANYRAVCRARSQAEFISKMAVVVEEADETAFWLELLIESGGIPQHRLNDLLTETKQLVAIFAASLRTAKINRT